jgi:hypothetical protein
MGKTLTTSDLMGDGNVEISCISKLEWGMRSAKNWMVQVGIAAEKTKDVG